ncbi:MAG: endonuclease MutS2, partial [Paludibacteraceae bacterium]|nr:endonuclease MutS2 [Paludibacteraceae bacterium]
MTYPDNFETKTGFDKIRDLLNVNCLSQLGRDKVSEMCFSSDYEVVLDLVNQTAEFVRILQEEDDFPVSNYYDVRDCLRKIAVEGTYLTSAELFDLRRSVETIGLLVRFFNNKEEEQYYYLKKLAGDVFVFPELLALIDRILDKFGQVKDNASPQLLEIRREMLAVQSSISRSLQGILRQAQSDGFVDKDVNPTMRDGRLVIPVSPAFKRKIKGIVHDESATGKTVFIEPEVVVEANNKIRELESRERREIIRILTSVTNEIRPRVDELFFSYEFLAQIDFIRAKALFAVQTNSVLPVTENRVVVDWYHAVHP